MLRLLTTTFIVATFLGGCITTYRVDIAQGNIVAQEMVDQLRPGMTRSQVRFVLGTPLVTDSFHPDRWDYFYSLRKGTDAKPETRNLTVIFKNDVLLSVEGDFAVKAAGVAAPAPTQSSESETGTGNSKDPLRLL
jgi:outer membrane protein assembly factor BamE